MWSQFTNITDGQTDDMRSQYCALHYSASRGKKTNFNNHLGVSILNADIYTFTKFNSSEKSCFE